MVNKLAKGLKLIDALSENAGKAFSYLILIIVVLETSEVILRKVFNNPTDWIWELCTLLAGAAFVMGGAWVHKEGKHVRTDVIFGNLSRKKQAIIDIFFFLTIFTSFVGVLIWKTVSNAAYSWKIHETTFTMWAPPLYPLKTVIALSFILFGLQGLAKFIRDVVFLVKGEEI